MKEGARERVGVDVVILCRQRGVLTSKVLLVYQFLVGVVKRKLYNHPLLYAFPFFSVIHQNPPTHSPFSVERKHNNKNNNEKHTSNHIPLLRPVAAVVAR